MNQIHRLGLPRDGQASTESLHSTGGLNEVQQACQSFAAVLVVATWNNDTRVGRMEGLEEAMQMCGVIGLGKLYGTIVTEGGSMSKLVRCMRQRQTGRGGRALKDSSRYELQPVRYLILLLV